MSNITINRIIQDHNAREAQKVLRGVIQHRLPYEHDFWKPVVDAASKSYAINHDHKNSRSMKSVSVSQILDRMNVDGLTFLINYFNTVSTEEAALLLANDFAYADCIEKVADITSWPFTQEIETLAELRDTDIEKDLMEIGGCAVEAEPEAETEVEAEAEPEAEADTSDTYAVPSAIASAANVLLEAATNGDETDLQALLDELVTLRKKPDYAAVPEVDATGEIPFGAPIRKNVQDVFGIQHEMLNFDINVYEWAGTNPLVPKIDENYIFNVDALHDCLWARNNKENAWLSGHTGTGKSTFIEQVCARTGYMFIRVGMDSGIERDTFIGIMGLEADDNGNNISKFVDGILPQAMQMPCVLLLDELDAVRPDIAYVLQPVLEGGALRLLEDGGRLVHPHMDFHICATGNSTGQGDSSGMYAAAVKVQSRAMVNRFSTHIRIDYLPIDDEMRLVRNAAPSLSDQGMGYIQDFVMNYRQGFLDGTIVTPISPRNTTTIGKYVDSLEDRIGTLSAVKKALHMNVMLTIDEADAIAVTGIMDRIS